MFKLRKIDIGLALVIGLAAALMMILIGRNLSAENSAFAVVMPYANYLLAVFPLFCLGVLVISYWLSLFVKKFIYPHTSFHTKKTGVGVYQLGKFCLVGGFNFLLDATILNIFIFATGIAAGFQQSVFKSVSFVVTVVSSYLWNKHWSFNSQEEHNKKEIISFFFVTIIGFLINVGLDYFFVNLVKPFGSMPPKTWAQFSAILAAAAGLVWNFAGLKLIVFKKKSIVLPTQEEDGELFKKAKA
ncbi:MAG: GtrA family protein [Candidatus Paceibacter sp.]|nr:GtrA family protein [Candidatus Paceibacter sp.]